MKDLSELWDWVVNISPIDGKVDNREVKELLLNLISERAENIRLQIRAEDCGRPAHNFPKGQPAIDCSVNEEATSCRMLRVPFDEYLKAKESSQ